jgi:hypothetical protein
VILAADVAGLGVLHRCHAHNLHIRCDRIVSTKSPKPNPLEVPAPVDMSTCWRIVRDEYLLQELGTQTGVDPENLAECGGWSCADFHRQNGSAVSRAMQAKRVSAARART